MTPFADRPLELFHHGEEAKFFTVRTFYDTHEHRLCVWFAAKEPEKVGDSFRW